MSRPTTPLPSLVPPKEQPVFASPARSTTHPVKPRHHIPHHPHRALHHHHDKSVPQSAIQPTTSNPFTASNSFGDFLSKTTSSGRADAGVAVSEEAERRERQRERQREKEEIENRERERSQWRMVEKLRTKRASVDNELHTILTTLSTLSTTTTRRLDYTYYSLLSSLSLLTTTLTSLHTLSTSTRSLTTQFNTTTNTLSADTQSQIETAAKGFKQQAERILDLEGRMRRGRERVKGLGERLEVVRVKVEGCEKRDREGRRAVGRRLMMLWGVLGCAGVLVLVLGFVGHWPAGGVDEGGRNRTWEGRVGGDVGLALSEGYGLGERRQHTNSRSEEAVRTSVHEDPILKLFDEL